MTDEIRLNRTGRVAIPGMFLPGFRSSLAIQDKVERNILFKCWGGLGDRICSEPTLRWAFENFQDCTISLATEDPELFHHLPFKRVFNLRTELPIFENYFVFETITPPNDTNMVWQFMSHMLVNCVDFPSLCAYRSQLPIAKREVRLEPKEPKFDMNQPTVMVHPGRHWTSKTFPKDWWDGVLTGLIDHNIRPCLVGADTDDNRGTVDVDTIGCLDMRGKLSINDSIYYLQRAEVVLTNDSAPLHMAVTGNAWVGYFATCKHPDFISHWRKGQWSWRMKDLALSGLYATVDHCPNKKDEVTLEHVDQAVLRSFLPDPKSVVDWTIEKLRMGAELCAS